MNDLNQWQGIGRLGKDPEARYTSAGNAVTSFSLACSRSWKDKNSGEKVEETEWINVTAFGKLGDICSQYLKKGAQVYVSGRLKTDKYDKNGVTHYSTKVIIDNMQMLGSRQDNQQGNTETPKDYVPQQSQSSQQGQAGGYFADDIPFAKVDGRYV